MKIQDNKLFTVEPKKGHLEPGEIGQIQITYRHLFPGQSKLPVLMKIAKGREILVIL
jgi:cilia- and flagella-associated protein 65